MTKILFLRTNEYLSFQKNMDFQTNFEEKFTTVLEETRFFDPKVRESIRFHSPISKEQILNLILDFLNGQWSSTFYERNNLYETSNYTEHLLSTLLIDEFEIVWDN